MMAPGMMSNTAAVVPDGKTETGQNIDLCGHISTSECYARNVSPRFPMTNLFIGDTRLGCKSDADEQIIIHVAFNTFVKVHSIKFTEFNLGSEPESAPTTVRLFVNRCNIGFEDVDDVDATQTIDLTPEDLREGGEALLLKFVKFQRVSSITIFIEDNDGGEVSALGGLQIYGRPVATTNMADFKKC